MPPDREVAVKKIMSRQFSLAVAMWVSSSLACHALTPLDTIADWICESLAERRAVAEMLALVAGQGSAQLSESFFMTCIDNGGYTPSLRSKRISEVAAGCTLIMTMPFGEAS
jgi:selenophosphate synthase